MTSALVSNDPVVRAAAFDKHATSTTKVVLRGQSYDVQSAASLELRTFGDTVCDILNDGSNISRHAALLSLRDAGVGGFHVLTSHRDLRDIYNDVRIELVKLELTRLRRSSTRDPQRWRWFALAAEREFEQEEASWIASMETALVDIVCGGD